MLCLYVRCVSAMCHFTRSVLAAVVAFFTVLTAECFATHDYPRTCNIYWGALRLEDCEALSKWDVVSLTTNPQDLNPAFLDTLRAKNPDIVLLAYFPVAFVWSNYDECMAQTGAAYGEKVDGCDWWLRDNRGNRLGTDGYVYFTNFSTKCPPDASGRHIVEWLADHICEQILATGCWDGLFLDGLFETSWWINNMDNFIAEPPAMIDADLDGEADDPDSLYAWWRPCVESFLTILRQEIGHDYILVANGKNFMSDKLNGGVRENFPKMHGGWAANMFSDYGYVTMCQQWLTTPMSCTIMYCMWPDDDNTLYVPARTASYEKFLRFTLTSSLLGDGYYVMNGRDESLWWDDYYDIDFGWPTSDVYLDSIWTDVYGCYRPLWKREFENATVMCNPGPDWVILEDDTWLAPEDGRIETHSTPPCLSVSVVKDGSERTFDQKDTSFGYQATVGNSSQHAVFAYVWATLSSDGEEVLSSNPRRFLVGAESSKIENLCLRTASSLRSGTYSLQVFVGGPDLASMASDTFYVERVLRFDTEVHKGGDADDGLDLTVYPDPVGTSGSIKVQVTGGAPDEDHLTTIRLYDVRGRLVSKIFDGQVRAGDLLEAGLRPTGSGRLGPGVYVLRADLPDRTLIRKIIVVR
jgi:hypothetical protein